MIGIVTALEKEYMAMDAMLEDPEDRVLHGQGAGRRYRIGKLTAGSGGQHAVVLALADMGTNMAAIRASYMLQHFPNLQSIIMVGIAGGVPCPSNSDEHVRLGDVVVSDKGGVIQYDFDKETYSYRTEKPIITPRPSPRPPSALLLEAVKLMRAQEMRGESQWAQEIERGVNLFGGARPSSDSDLLFDALDPTRRVAHPVDPKRVAGQPRVFLGSIASANKLLKNPFLRDALRDQYGVKAVEMEASGIADATWNYGVGYLVVRGICDYCDSHKNDPWQNYAAVVAAAYTRGLLRSMPVENEFAGVKQVQVIIERDYQSFDTTRQQELIGVLAVLLKTDIEHIRILNVSAGSIVMLLEMPAVAVFRLASMFRHNDSRLRAVGIISVAIEDEATEPLSGQLERNLPTSFITSRSGGADLSAQGDINVGGDAIGRDKVVSAGGHIISAAPGASVFIGEYSSAQPQDLPPAPGEPPFKGLQYFDESDADLFFGRELLTADLVKRLTQHRCLVVVGASGSGKSSVVRAGLIPAIRLRKPLVDGTLPPYGSEHWSIHVITPTSRPLETLAASLTRNMESVKAVSLVADELAQDPRSLHLAARKILSHSTSRNRLLLVVDQFEELFTLCHSEAERKAYIDNLLTAVAPEIDGPTIVVIVLRADFYAHCAQYGNLREVLSQYQKYIGAMNPNELRMAIEGPAKLGRWDFEAGLVEMLIRDVGEEPGALALLSHALLETWQHRRERTLTFAGYIQAGRVQGAIAKTADTVFNYRLTPEQQTIARHIFLHLTDLGEGTQDTRRRATLSELVIRPQQETAVRSVLTILSNERLIVADQDRAGNETVEVAHEALIREWPSLRKWLNDNREWLRIHGQLRHDAEQWKQLDQDSGALYRGARLTRALDWATDRAEELTMLEHEFLTASQELVEHERQERRASINIEDEQRKKLARDLHDGPTQSVAAIAMRINYARTLLLKSPARVPEELEKIETLARSTTIEMRQLLFTLRPLILETQGLKAALEVLAQKLHDTDPNLNVHLELDEDIEKLDKDAQGMVFYVLEEAVGNARKHAEATDIWISAHRDVDAYLIAVRDNGIGFDVSKVQASYDKRGSLGMVNMSERAEVLKAKLTIASAVGQGTRVMLRLPLERILS